MVQHKLSGSGPRPFFIRIISGWVVRAVLLFNHQLKRLPTQTTLDSRSWNSQACHPLSIMLLLIGVHFQQPVLTDFRTVILWSSPWSNPCSSECGHECCSGLGNQASCGRHQHSFLEQRIQVLDWNIQMAKEGWESWRPFSWEQSILYRGQASDESLRMRLFPLSPMSAWGKAFNFWKFFVPLHHHRRQNLQPSCHFRICVSWHNAFFLVTVRVETKSALSPVKSNAFSWVYAASYNRSVVLASRRASSRAHHLGMLLLEQAKDHCDQTGTSLESWFLDVETNLLVANHSVQIQM